MRWDYSPAGHQPSISWSRRNYHYYFYYYYHYYYIIIIIIIIIITIIIILLLLSLLLSLLLLIYLIKLTLKTYKLFIALRIANFNNHFINVNEAMKPHFIFPKQKWNKS